MMLAKVRYVALLTKPAILNNANVALVDAVIDALTITLIKDDDDLLGTINSYIKLRRLRATDLPLSADNLEDEKATTAKDLTREQKERLKALLNAKTRDSLSARVGTAIEHCTLEE
ncbi:hypothetical protein HBI16_251350 [Parastagonospora nodorum]|nr:hypothetical protein HBI16_251350 [Parastagonospora nodorum]